MTQISLNRLVQSSIPSNEALAVISPAPLTITTTGGGSSSGTKQIQAVSSKASAKAITVLQLIIRCHQNPNLSAEVKQKKITDLVIKSISFLSEYDGLCVSKIIQIAHQERIETPEMIDPLARVISEKTSDCIALLQKPDLAIEDIIDILSASARMRVTNPSLYEAIAAACFLRLPQFSLQNLRDLAGNFALAGIKDERLLHAISGAVLSYLQKTAFVDIVTSLETLSNIPVEEKIYETLALSTLSAIKEHNLSPSDLAKIAYHFGKCKINIPIIPVLFDSIANEVFYQTDQKKTFVAKDLVDLAWSFATLRIPYKPLFDLIEEKINPQVKELSLFHLQKLMWSFIQLNFCNQSLYDTLSTAVTLKVNAGEAITPKHLAALTLVFSKSSFFNEELFKVLKAKALESMDAFSHHDLAILSVAFSKINQYDEALFTAIIHKTCRREVFSSVRLEDLHLQVKAFSKLRVRSKKFFDMISSPSAREKVLDWLDTREDVENFFSPSDEEDLLREKILSVEPTDLIDLAWAFSELDCMDEPLFKELSVRLLSCVKTLRVKDIVTILFSFSRLHSKECNVLFNTMEAELLQNQRLKEAGNEDLIDIANAFVVRNVPNCRLFDALAEIIITRIASFLPDQLVEIAGLLSTQDFENKKLLFVELEKALVENDQINVLSSEDLADMASIFAEMGSSSANSFEKIAGKSLEKIHDFDIQDISKIVCALVLGVTFTFPFKEALVQGIRARIHNIAGHPISQEIIKSASPKDLAKIAKTLQFFRTEEECKEMWKVLIFSIKSKISSLDIPTLKEMTILFGSISLPSSLSQPLYMSFSREWVVNQKLSSLPLSDMVLIAESYAKKRIEDIPLFDMIAKRTIADIGICSIKSLSLLARAFRTLGIDNESFFDVVEKEFAISTKWESADPEDLRDFAYCFASRKTQNAVESLRKIAALTIVKLPNFDYPILLEISEIFYDQPTEMETRGSLLQAIEMEVTRRDSIGNLPPQDMAKALCVFATIRSHKSAFMDSLLGRILPHIDSLSFEDLASLAYGLSLSTIRNTDFVDKLTTALQSKINPTQWKNLGKVLFSITKLGVALPKAQALAQALASALIEQEKIKEVSSEELTKMAQTFMDLRLLDHPFLEMIGREFLEMSQKYTPTQLNTFSKVYIQAGIPLPLKIQVCSCIIDKLPERELVNRYSSEEILQFIELFHPSPLKGVEISRCLEKLARVLTLKISSMDVATLEKVATMYQQITISQEVIVKLFSSIASVLAKKEMADTLSPEKLIKWVDIISSVPVELTQTRMLYETFAEVAFSKISYIISAKISIPNFVYQLADLEVRGTASTQFIVAIAKEWQKTSIRTVYDQCCLHSLFYALIRLELNIKGKKAMLEDWLGQLTQPQVVPNYTVKQIISMLACIGKLPMERQQMFTLIQPFLKEINKNWMTYSVHDLIEILLRFRNLSIVVEKLLPGFFHKIELEIETLSLQELSIVADQIGRYTHWHTPQEEPFTRSLRDATVPLLHSIIIKLQERVMELRPLDLANIVSSVKECDVEENKSELNRIFIRKTEDLLKIIPTTLKERPFHPESYARVIEGFWKIQNMKVFFQKPEVSVLRFLAPIVNPQYLVLVSKNLKDFASCDLLKILISFMGLEVNNEPLFTDLAKELLERSFVEIPSLERVVYIENLGKLLNRKQNLYHRFPYFQKVTELLEKLKSLPV